MMFVSLLALLSAMHPTCMCENGNAWAPVVSIHVDEVAWTTQQRFTDPYRWGNQFLSWGPGAGGSRWDLDLTFTWCGSDEHMRHFTVSPYGIWFFISGVSPR